MTRIFLYFALALSLVLGACTIHHTSSASYSASAHGRIAARPKPETTRRPAQVNIDRRAMPERGKRPPRAEPEPEVPVTPEPEPEVPVTPEPEPEVPVTPEPEPQPEPEPEPVEEEPVFGSTEESDGTFEGNVYFLPANTQKIPDLDALEPVGKVYTAKLDIAPRQFDQGFPGISERFEWFAIRYSANVVIDEAGEYTFRLNSDDGSKLYISGQLVIDNDGQHAPKSKGAKVELEAGVHEFVIEYFQGPRYQIALQFFFTPPGAQEQIFSLE